MASKKKASKKKSSRRLARLPKDAVELLAVSTEGEVADMMRRGREILAFQKERQSDLAAARKLIAAARRTKTPRRKRKPR
jgi:HD superfamily phosphodiesterase